MDVGELEVLREADMTTVVDVLPLKSEDCSPERVKQFLASSRHELAKNILGFSSWTSPTGAQHCLVQFASPAHAIEARKLSSTDFWISPIPQTFQYVFRNTTRAITPPIVPAAIPESSAATPFKRATKKRKLQPKASLNGSNESSSAPMPTDTPSDAEPPAPVVKKSKPNSTKKRQRSKRKSIASGDLDITIKTQPQGNEAAETRDAGAAATAENGPTSVTNVSPVQPPSTIGPSHIRPASVQDDQQEASSTNLQGSPHREALWKTLDAFGLDTAQVVQVDSAIQLGDTIVLEEMISLRKAEMEKLRTELEEERKSRIVAETERARCQKEKAALEVFLPAIMKAREVLKDLVKSSGSGTES